MRKQKLFFRVDGGTEIGMGHMVRCSALYQMICELNVETTLLTSSEERGVLESWEKLGVNICHLPKKSDLLDELNIIYDILESGDIIVVDHYGAKKEYFMDLRHHGYKVIQIDDFALGTYYSHIIINHSEGLVKSNYQLAYPDSILCIGTDYVLLRPEFLKMAKEDNIKTESRAITICFGGADSNNLTKKVLTWVREYGYNSKINVIVGSSYSYTDQIVEYTKMMEGVDVKINLDASNMALTLADSRLFIGPSSSVSVEACACRVPILTGYYVDNQMRIYDGLVGSGSVIGIGSWSGVSYTIFAESLSLALTEAKSASMMSAQRLFVDGNSSTRLRSIVSTLII